ncbi:solute carrier family 35 member F6-like [Glandiceps talaboti]
MVNLTLRTKFRIVLATGMLLTGCINTLTKKAQNDFVLPGVAMPISTNSSHSESKPHPFDHPWLQTGFLVVGEAICFVAFLVQRWYERINHRKKFLDSNIQDTSEELLAGTVTPFNQPRICQPVILIPAALHLLSNSLGGIGLVLVSAYVWQMLRGCTIIFTGISAKIFLKRKLFCVHWSGMVVTMFGLCLVGLSSIFEEDNSKKAHEITIGIFLILASQVIQALQMTLEESVLKKRGYLPLHIVSMKGIYGMILMCTIVLPILYYIPDNSKYSHRFEDSVDALLQIQSDYRLLALCLGYILSVAFFNFFSMSITKTMTAVHGTLIDACRTIVVWVVSLLIFYFIDENFGEPFNTTWGILQIDGFVFLVIGTLLYNEVLDTQWIPGCRRNRSQENQSTNERTDQSQSTNMVTEQSQSANKGTDDNHVYVNQQIENPGVGYRNTMNVNADIDVEDDVALLTK